MTRKRWQPTSRTRAASPRRTSTNRASQLTRPVNDPPGWADDTQGGAGSRESSPQSPRHVGCHRKASGAVSTSNGDIREGEAMRRKAVEVVGGVVLALLAVAPVSAQGRSHGFGPPPDPALGPVGFLLKDLDLTDAQKT